jgi:pimeloyl-ACP methyl ester carboxylesterase
METQLNTLFLHGGPGLHSAVERTWFGDTLPILWWDQPFVTEDSTPFRTLVAHAGRQLEAMAESTGGRVDLIAHSFGGQIAAALAREYPGLLRRITFLGCPHDRISHFFMFARRLLEAGYERPGLKEALAAVEESCDGNRFIALIQACYPAGTFPNNYFGPHSTEVRERYFEVAGRAPPIDIATFFAVMEEALHTPNSTQPAGFDGEVSIVMGRDDPLLDLDVDKQKWSKVFPQAEFTVVDAGHFVHLELPPEAWCRDLVPFLI